MTNDFGNNFIFLNSVNKNNINLPFLEISEDIWTTE